MKVTRTEQQMIKRSHPLWRVIDEMCFHSKNLYNEANYMIRQEFINNHNYIKYKQLLQQPINFNELKNQSNIIYNNVTKVIKVINGKNKEINTFINPFNKTNNWFFGDPNAILSKTERCSKSKPF